MKTRNLLLSKPQAGAATLVVVMMLFLVMALLAAYANRGQMFEQRMASGYVRSTVAQQASEAGLEWSIAMLNGGNVDDACLSSTAAGSSRFVDRYLSVAIADRSITSAVTTGLSADCRLESSSWVCRCPAPGSRAAPTALATANMVPSFGVSLSKPNDPRNGSFSVVVRGCTDSVIDNCGDELAVSQRQRAVDLQTYLVALVPAMRSPPAAPLIAKGNVTSTGDGLGLHNTDPMSAGLLYVTGGTATGLLESRLSSVPGTPSELVKVSNDAALAGLDAHVFLKNFMGAAKERYVKHPALRKVVCAADCADALAAAYASGKRMMYVDGDMTISSDRTLGTVSEPLLVYASGNVTLSGPMMLTGILIVGQDLTWAKTTVGTSMVKGSVLVAGNVATFNAVDILYSQTVMDQLRNRIGSYVKVPGSWVDEAPR